jgi:hypothetical protein
MVSGLPPGANYAVAVKNSKSRFDGLPAMTRLRIVHWQRLGASLLFWAALVSGAHAVPTPYGYWSFDDPANRVGRTGGGGNGSMTINGSSCTYVAGPNGATDRAILLSGTVSGSPDGTSSLKIKSLKKAKK